MEVQKNQLKAWLYLAPTILLLCVFTFYPLIKTIVISFLGNYNYATEYHTGFSFENYEIMIGYQKFWDTYLKNTIIIVFVSVPISVILSLFIAVGLNSIKKLTKLFQTIFFLPYVTNTIAIGMVFGVMFSTNGGLVNTVLRAFGSEPINWLGGTLYNTAGTEKIGITYWHSMFVVLFYSVWNAIPFKILILLSGLQGIDKQYYQAAQIDGTPKWRILWRITVPLLSPQIAYLATTSFIGAFKEYTSIVAIFGEDVGPLGNKRGMGTIVFFIYDNMGGKGEIGLPAATATFLFVIILIFTALNLWVSKKRVHY